MTIITIISHPKREGMESTMGDNAVVDAPEFQVNVEGVELTFAEQAAMLRSAADQLDPPEKKGSEG